MSALGKILDYSQARPPLGKVKGNGYAGVYRYVCSDAAEAGLPGKRLTPSERDQILAAGLDLGLHGEDNAGAAQVGYPRGLEQGKQWAGYAHDVLAAPKGMTIVAAVDYDTAGTYPAVVSDYLHGVRDGFAGQYVLGVYGSIYVVDAALAEHTAVHGVQTVAWSHGKVSTWAHLYQHGGSEFPGTDYNDVLRVPHGTWLQTLNGGNVSATGPEFWDANDWKAFGNHVWADLVDTGAPGAATGVAGRRLSNIDERVVPLSGQIHQQAVDTQAAVAKVAQSVADLTALVKQSPSLSGTLDVTGALTFTEQPTP